MKTIKATQIPPKIGDMSETIECPDCEGEGRVETGISCIRPAHNCCGGCVQEEECPTCKGNKTVQVLIIETNRDHE